MGGKNDDKEKSRLSFFSVAQKYGCWFYGVALIVWIIVVVVTVFKQWNNGWGEILKWLGIIIPVSASGVVVLFMMPEIMAEFRQRCAKRRMARNRMIAEKVRAEVERDCDHPTHFNELVKNQAFRLLEKHRPPRFSRIRKRKSMEYNKMIAREILCAMRVNLRGNLNNFDEELEERAFQALEKYRSKPLFLRKRKR